MPEYEIWAEKICATIYLLRTAGEVNVGPAERGPVTWPFGRSAELTAPELRSAIDGDRAFPQETISG